MKTGELDSNKLKVEVRGVVINTKNGIGEKNVTIVIFNKKENKIVLEFQSGKDGFFKFELDNSVQYDFIIDTKEFHLKKFYIPKGIGWVYIRAQVEPKTKIYD